MPHHRPPNPSRSARRRSFSWTIIIVDNRWALKQKREAVLRVFHAPVKHAGNPLLAGETGFVSVAKDEQAGVFRMWYQTHTWTGKGPEDESKTHYGIAYAESKDGVAWERPKLGLHEWKGTKENNIVYKGFNNSRASGPQILQLPEADRRGFRFVLTYRTSGAKRGNNGVRVVGSQDGIHWDEKQRHAHLPAPERHAEQHRL
jgi:hypothetical protein